MKAHTHHCNIIDFDIFGKLYSGAAATAATAGTQTHNFFKKVLSNLYKSEKQPRKIENIPWCDNITNNY